MRGWPLLAWRHVQHHVGQTTILVVCLVVSMSLPALVQVVTARYETDLTARADATPHVVGTRGSRFDLTLAALYFRPTDVDPVPYGAVDELAARREGVVIPLHQRFTARGFPVVATSPEYYELRGLRPTVGTVPLIVGDALLGADAADELGLAVGDALFSDPAEVYDISKPSAIKLRVCGLLPRVGTPDDAAVFTDVGTAWLLEGLAHGHEDVAEGEIDESLVLKRSDEVVMVSGALIEANEMTDDVLASVHSHGDPATFPLTALIVVPDSAKSGTLMTSRVNAEGELQMVAPRDVIDDLMAVVFRIKALLDTFAVVLAVATGLLIVLVMLLTTRLRAREMATLHRMGCGRSIVAKLYAGELLAVLAIAAAISVAVVAGVLAALPDLVHVF